MSDSSTAPSPLPQSLASILAWRRVRFTLIAALPYGLLLSVASVTPTYVWVGRALTVGLLAMLVFGILERVPLVLPAWLARWALQVTGVTVSVPFGAYLAYWMTTGGNLRFWTDSERLNGYAELCFTGILFMPWMALGAMVRQREALARGQALSFQLERSELERQALDARLRLLQTQVQPHFLFNTLANIRALVRAGSPQAPRVLDSLIAYLQAAVPQLDEPSATLAQELQRVRAYLDLMHMRIPDRLQFSVDADAAAGSLRCPPMALLTLVENAVRHGIDPSEEGGRIDVVAAVRDGRCTVRVSDSGVGLGASAGGGGTGLSTLRERMALEFGGDAQVRLIEIVPHGVCAVLDFPAQDVAPPAPQAPDSASPRPTP